MKSIVDRLTDEREKFERFARSLTEEEMARGDPGNHRGSPGFDVDQFNASAVGERCGRSLDDILDERANLRGRLIAIIARFSDPQLDSTVRFAGDRKRPPVDRPFDQLLTGWACHDAIHVADMLKALPEGRDVLEIAAWLDRPDLAPAISAYQKAMG